jgi:hypothetical protein
VRRRNGKQLLTFSALAGSIVLSGAAEDGLALWDKSINLRGALGYKDNVLLSSIQEQGSAFWQSAVDVMLLRLNTDPAAGTFSFFVTGEDRRYFSSLEVDKEQLVLSQAKWEQPFLENWKWGAIAQYMYADQVFDASATEELLQTLPVKSHNFQSAPYLSRQLPANFSLELKATLERQYFSDPLDDYWEGGPQLTLTKRYGHRSDLALIYIYDHRTYDTRRQIDLNAAAIPDTSLAFHQHEFEATLLHAWDKGRHWRSRLRAVYERNDDNGPGYYDYDRYRWSKRFGYYGADWEATVEGKILHYDYARQRVSDSSEVRAVWEYSVAFRAEKMVYKKLKIFAESEHEKVDSNYALEEYTVNTVLGGVDWEF